MEVRVEQRNSVDWWLDFVIKMVVEYLFITSKMSVIEIRCHIESGESRIAFKNAIKSNANEASLLLITHKHIELTILCGYSYERCRQKNFSEYS